MAIRLAECEQSPSRLRVADDREFAESVARRQPDAVIAFRTQFAHVLDDGFAGMQSMLARCQPPGCCIGFDPLVSHVAGASGEGYLKRIGSSRDERATGAIALEEHVPGLAMVDLFHASACLKQDAAACLRLVKLVDEIKPPLIRRFRQRLSPGRCEQIVDDVLSQAWSTPRRRSDGSPALSEEGTDAFGRSRLETYLGLSGLKTWLYSMGFRMLLDEARTARRESVSLDDEGFLSPAGRGNDRPDQQAATDELAARFRPRLQSELAAALDALKARKNSRLAHVAYLWLSCRLPQVQIAQILGVTKPRISQQVKEITDLLCDATAGLCSELSEQCGMPLEPITSALRGNLQQFFAPALLDAILAEFRKARTSQPQLVHVAYLTLGCDLSLQELADQLGEPPARAAALQERFEVWRRAVEQRVAQQLSVASGVPVEWMEQAVRFAIDAGFRSATAASADAVLSVRDDVRDDPSPGSRG